MKKIIASIVLLVILFSAVLFVYADNYEAVANYIPNSVAPVVVESGKSVAYYLKILNMNVMNQTVASDNALGQCTVQGVGESSGTDITKVDSQKVVSPSIIAFSVDKQFSASAGCGEKAISLYLIPDSEISNYGFDLGNVYIAGSTAFSNHYAISLSNQESTEAFPLGSNIYGVVQLKNGITKIKSTKVSVVDKEPFCYFEWSNEMWGNNSWFSVKCLNGETLKFVEDSTEFFTSSDGQRVKEGLEATIDYSINPSTKLKIRIVPDTWFFNEFIIYSVQIQ